MFNYIIKFMSKIRVIIIIAIFTLFHPIQASAYIDPASISFLFQTIAVVMSTIILYIRKPSEILKDLKKLYIWTKKKLKKKEKD